MVDARMQSRLPLPTSSQSAQLSELLHTTGEQSTECQCVRSSASYGHLVCHFASGVFAHSIRVAIVALQYLPVTTLEDRTDLQPEPLFNSPNDEVQSA